MKTSKTIDMFRTYQRLLPSFFIVIEAEGEWFCA